MRFGGLVIAIVLAAVAAVVVMKMSADEAPPPVTASQSAPAPKPVQTTNIYVASQPIPVGTTVKENMIMVQPWPSHLVLPGFAKSDAKSSIVGMVTRSAFQKQEPMLMTKLSNANDPNFLAGSLPKGMRVITIQTNEIEGVAGFVFPGDYVDIILTHDIQKYVTRQGEERPMQVTRPVTETLLTNAKVLAVDQRAGGTSVPDEKGNLPIPRSVSLMVTQSDAQRLRLGQRKGTLTLALRSLADRETADPLIATTDQDVSQFPPDDASVGPGGSNVIIFHGVERQEQRSSMVMRPPVSAAAPAVPATTTPITPPTTAASPDASATSANEQSR